MRLMEGETGGYQGQIEDAPNIIIEESELMFHKAAKCCWIIASLISRLPKVLKRSTHSAGDVIQGVSVATSWTIRVRDERS